MKLSTAAYILLQIPTANAGIGSKDNLPKIVDDLNLGVTYPEGQPCLTKNEFHIAVDKCDLDHIAEAVEDLLPLECPHQDGATEINLIYGGSDPIDKIKAICEDGWQDRLDRYEYPWDSVTGYGEKWDKQYFDGKTDWNESYETITDAIDPENPGNHLKTDANRVRSLYEGEARYYPIEDPAHLENFENCELRSMMCCWTADRQANDNNGNCAKPYDDNCVDADPGDNTDLCSVDMSRSVNSNHLNGGFAMFPKDSSNNNDNGAEGPIHCHGLAWGADEMEADARYRANNLFFISMYDHMYQRGYVRNVPGAPMCGCVEKMPKVSRSDCTEIEADERWVLTWDTASLTFTAKLEKAHLTFNSCNGNPNNNNLESFYRRLMQEGRATEEEFYKFKETVVGDHQCDEAIAAGVLDQGFEFLPNQEGGAMYDWYMIASDYAIRTISASGDGESVYAITIENQLLQYSVTDEAWTDISDGKTFQQVSANYDGSMLWAVDRNDGVYLRESGSWTSYDQQPMNMVSVSGDGAHLWGINDSDQIYYRPGKDGEWTLKPGTLRRISVNYDGTAVWATNVWDTVYYTAGAENVNWKRVNGKYVKHISLAGDGAFWGVSYDGNVSYRSGYEGSWVNVGGDMRIVSVNKESNGLWGVDKFDRLWYRPGLEGKDGTNYALFGTASQSSTGWGGNASRAIDGNTSGYWHHSSVTHTQRNNKAWWKVQLQNDVIINKINVWNRYDCCWDRLSNANVDILDENGAVIETKNIGAQNNREQMVTELEFDNVRGSAVRVQLTDTDYLSLAEVQVFGELYTPTN